MCLTTHHHGNRIPIHERVELPESWIPADSRVEIDAKITAGTEFSPSPPLFFAFFVASASSRGERRAHAADRKKILAGYFTTGHRMTADELKAVQGRIWEE